MHFEEADIPALLRLLQLKRVQRKGWTRYPISSSHIESVADHSFSVALLCWLFCPPQLDRQKVMEMALLHDLAEVITGDITPSDKVLETLKRSDESEALNALLSPFGSVLQQRGVDLLQEYQSGLTPEAEWVKALDKAEMALQSLVYEKDNANLKLGEFRDKAKELFPRLFSEQTDA